MAFTANKAFYCTSEQLYNAISNMLIDNAKVYNKKVNSNTALIDVKYETEGDMKTSVQVTEAKFCERIVYVTNKTNLETYEVSFDITPNDDEACYLDYSVKIVTEKKRVELNNGLVGMLYKRKQKKAFARMCQFLNSQIRKED